MNVLASSPPNTEPSAAIVAAFNRRTAGSKSASAYNRGVLADKSMLGFGFSPEMKEALYPIVASKVDGAHLWDVDGNRYIDILMGLGVNLFGHNPPFIREAIEAQLDKGFAVGPQAVLAGDTAALFLQLTGKERLTFSNTGTEAVSTALRIARAATGRSRIALFTNAYHGHLDQTLNLATKLEYLRRGIVRNNPPGWRRLIRPFLKRMMLTRAVPAFPGVSDATARDVMLLDYFDPRSLDILRRKADQLAAILVEPVQSRFPEYQPGEFLRELRTITAKSGTALIFDEMISGFRVAPGGAQSHFGVEADIATYGKIAGGGLPLSLIAGSNRFMNHIDGGPWFYGDASAPPVRATFFAGTYCRHPLALAAAHATATHLIEKGPALQEGLNARTAGLVDRLNASMRAEGLAVVFTCFGSFFSVAMTRSAIPAQVLNLLSLILLSAGVHLRCGDRGGFLSTAHTDEHIDAIHAAFVRGLRSLAGAGLLGHHDGSKTV